MRASRKLHRPWLQSPITREAYDRLLVRVQDERYDPLLVCLRGRRRDRRVHQRHRAQSEPAPWLRSGSARSTTSRPARPTGSTSTGSAWPWSGFPARDGTADDDWYALGDRCCHEDYSLSEGEVLAERRSSAPSTVDVRAPDRRPPTLPATKPVPGLHGAGRPGRRIVAVPREPPRS